MNNVNIYNAMLWIADNAYLPVSTDKYNAQEYKKCSGKNAQGKDLDFLMGSFAEKLSKGNVKLLRRRKTRKHLATTEEEFFVNILATKLPARAARELFRNKT